MLEAVLLNTPKVCFYSHKARSGWAVIELTLYSNLGHMCGLDALLRVGTLLLTIVHIVLMP